MKRSDIRLGSTYTNGKGAERRIIGEGAHLRRRACTVDSDCVEYEIIKRGRGPLDSVGKRYACTRTAFTRWATDTVTTDL